MQHSIRIGLAVGSIVSVEELLWVLVLRAVDVSMCILSRRRFVSLWIRRQTDQVASATLVTVVTTGSKTYKCTIFSG